MDYHAIKTSARQFREDDFDVQVYPPQFVEYLDWPTQMLVRATLAEAKNRILEILSGSMLRTNRVNVQDIAKDDDWTQPIPAGTEIRAGVIFTDENVLGKSAITMDSIRAAKKILDKQGGEFRTFVDKRYRRRSPWQ